MRKTTVLHHSPTKRFWICEERAKSITIKWGYVGWESHPYGTRTIDFHSEQEKRKYVDVHVGLKIRKGYKDAST